MRLFLFAGLLCLLVDTLPAAAQGRVTLGWGHLFNNDVLGDGQDRWRTTAAVVSQVKGRGWDGALPTRAGEIIEYRFRGDIIAPANLVNPAPGDRRYAGTLGFGLHTHFQRRGAEISLGADLVFTGPQTGLGELQREIHRALGTTIPTVLGNQIENGFHPTVTLELGRTMTLSQGVELRPFVELQGGVETLARIGADLRIGGIGDGELLLRDAITGQRYRVTDAGNRGWAGVIGADIAHVEHSTYLPSSDGYVLTDSRPRVRAGLHWQGEKSSVFYGVTWLGEEFTAQPEGQVMGSLRLNLEF